MQILNKLILGTVQLGMDYGINNIHGKPDKAMVDEILQDAYDHGIDTLDSAESYGNAHEVIGDFHRRHPNRVFKVITKLPHIFDERIEDKINLYLNDLAVTSLEVLMFHSFATYAKHYDDVDYLLDIKLAGKIKFIGVSVYTNQEIETVIKDDRIDVIQLPFNLFDNSAHRESILKEAKVRGKIIHTRSVFLQGLFFKNPEDSNHVVRQVKSQLSLINKISLDNNVSIESMALNYVLKQNYIDNVLVGVDSKVHLLQNINAVKEDLNEDVIDQINAIEISNIDLLNPSLWN